jgi:hypothetical protein
MSLWSRVANVFRGDRLNRDIEEELQSHIAEAITEGRDPAIFGLSLGSNRCAPMQFSDGGSF